MIHFKGSASAYVNDWMGWFIGSDSRNDIYHCSQKTWLLQCTSGHVYMTTIIRLLYNNDTNLIWCVYMHFVFVFLIKHPVNMTSLTMTSLSVRAVLMCHLLVCKTCKVTFSFSTRSHCNKIHLLLHFYTFADVKEQKKPD